MFGLLELVRKTVGPGVLIHRGVFRHAEVARRIAGAIIQDVGGPQTDLSLERRDAGDLRAAQVVSQRRLDQIAGERFAWNEAAILELRLAGGE